MTKLLTKVQEDMIHTLLEVRDVSTAAKQTGVNFRTIYRWLDDPKFRAALSKAEGTVISQASRRLINLQDNAIDVMQSVLDDPKIAPAVRLRAAQNVLDNLLRLRELYNLEERISKLEEATNGKSQAAN